ncbi:MAG: hypothetical protein ACR2PX_27190 [Endozoicomonas sp.]|uniref:hypothetical protein n=1 Tax=Endozoicomonas sp. TaxID=1892382 RepID=UPI003D9AB70E
MDLGVNTTASRVVGTRTLLSLLSEAWKIPGWCFSFAIGIVATFIVLKSAQSYFMDLVDRTISSMNSFAKLVDPVFETG